MKYFNDYFDNVYNAMLVEYYFYLALWFSIAFN
jgi:hypothetical protein